VVVLLLDRSPVEVGQRHGVRCDLDDLALADLHRLAGVRDERGDVGGQEVLAVAEPDDQRRVSPGRHHPVRGVGVDGDQGERALEPPAHRPHRLGQLRAGCHLGGQEVRHDLGIGVGRERDAVVLEL
jgi:hypothetical protein